MSVGVQRPLTDEQRAAIAHNAAAEQRELVESGLERLANMHSIEALLLVRAYLPQLAPFADGCLTHMGLDINMTKEDWVETGWCLVDRVINGETLPASMHPREVVEALADDGVLKRVAPAPATKTGLAPVVDANSRVLILGTLPATSPCAYSGTTPTVQPILDIVSRVYDEPVGNEYDERLAFLRRHSIALWDVLKSAEREGSTDSKIKNPIPNDFGAFFADYPNLRAVALTGSDAPRYWRRMVKQSAIPATMRIVQLPSTSPIPGRHVLGLDEKVDRWKDFLTSTL